MHIARIYVQLLFIEIFILTLSAPTLLCVSADVWFCVPRISFKCFKSKGLLRSDPLYTINHVECVRTHTFLCLLCC